MRRPASSFGIRWRFSAGRYPSCRGYFLALLFWVAAAAGLHAQVSNEYDLKAVLLYNFTQFVDWPATAFATPEAPLVIGILGRDPFGPVLDELVAQENVGHRRIVV